MNKNVIDFQFLRIGEDSLMEYFEVSRGRDCWHVKDMISV